VAEVKSLWSIYFGLHTCYKDRNKKMQKSNLELILKNYLVRIVFWNSKTWRWNC